MDSKDLSQLAERLSRREVSLEEFLRELARPKTADLNEVQLDLDRGRRCGYPEVVYGEGKSLAALEKTLARMVAEKIDVLVTRLAPELAAELQTKFLAARYNPVARTLRLPILSLSSRSSVGHVAIITAGTSDLPVAEEARETLAWMGIEATMIQDVGVAGPHRLHERLHLLKDVDAVVVVAGMEVRCPAW